VTVVRSSVSQAAVASGWANERPPTGSRWGEYARHPLSGGALNVIGVLAGIFGAVIAEDVQNFVLDFLPHTEPVKPYKMWAVVVFGTSALLLMGLFACRQWAIDRQRGRDHLRLQNIAERIQSTVRTHPPREFMQALTIAVEKSFVIARDASSQTERELAIRLILKNLAELAGTFEGSNLSVGANLMVYLPRTSAQWDRWYSEIKFFDGNPASLAGLLVLPAALSATHASVDRDPGIRNLALPIPSDPGGALGTEKWNVLPGAPLSFIRKQFEWFCPVSQLHDWCVKSCDLRDAIKRELKAYFDGMSFSGFLSMPVFSPSPNFQTPQERDVLAVVNVHWEGGSRLTVVEAANNFAEAISPMCVMLAELLKRTNIPPPTDLSSGAPSSSPAVS
jgi:hypothetical protein